MILTLSIKNYALIESLELNPSGFLNVITGETGAGKSIILGAIGLLLGKRADTKVLFNSDQKCSVEGVFDIESYGLQEAFEAYDIDYENECIVRREISPAGKSRAFINDMPVTLDVLKMIGPRLLDVHGQHETLELSRANYQREMLDHYGGYFQTLNEYQRQFKQYDVVRKRLLEVKEKASQEAKDTDYQQFIFEELQQANLRSNEQQELEESLAELENAEAIKTHLMNATQLMDEGEVAATQQLKVALTELGKVQKFGASYEELYERLNSSLIELRDIASEIQSLNESVIHDPERLSEVQDRINLIYRLQQKHGVTDIASLIELQEKLEQELLAVNNREEVLAKLEIDLQEAQNSMREKAAILTKERKKMAAQMSQAVEAIIRKIGIENGRLEIRIHEQEPDKFGADEVQFWFSANKGSALRPIKEVASGGEYSRLTFALKYLIADKTALPTVIFDEIDTGVSGEVAKRMIKLMKVMAGNHQIISISHLPQFAAGANHHYLVYKDHSSDKSISRIKKLETEERIEEIAGMIGGDNPSATAKQSAKELLAELAN